MLYNDDCLIHEKKEFSKESLLLRKDKFGFNNLARMEIFLWDLEIYMQIQAILNDKITLKGGAAAQFYLPIENQRTSVDIDLIAEISEKELSEAIKEIETKFNGYDRLFKFRAHKPKSPKTNLPLKTYFIDVPSAIEEGGIQQIKCEFFFLENAEINKVTSPELFACETSLTYNILPLNSLIGDKLTTLGPNTIGIQDDRSDEQIKQVYDLIELIEHNIDKIDLQKVKEYYQKRAKPESDDREIKYDFSEFINDAINFIDRYRFLDINKNKELENQVNNFQSLYLRKRVNRHNSGWAIVSRKLSLFLNFLRAEKSSVKPEINSFKKALTSSSDLLFSEYTGKEKSDKTNSLKDKLIAEFGSTTSVSERILKGKTLQRIFWEIISQENSDDVTEFIEKNKSD